MSSATYKGYTARIEFNACEGILWGKVLGLPASIPGTGGKPEPMDFESFSRSLAGVIH